MKRVEICVRDESGEVISRQELELDTGSGRVDDIEQAVEQFRQRALKELTGDLIEQEQARFIAEVKKNGCYRLNGTHRVELKSLHGKVTVAVQRFIERQSGARYTYFDLTECFRDGYITLKLHAWSAYYSNRMSYEEVAKLLASISGERVLSDQRIEQLVIAKATAISAEWSRAEPVAVTSLPGLNPEVGIYQADEAEIRLFEDGIGVKGQKATRQRHDAATPCTDTADSTPRVMSDIALLECHDGHYEYLCEGIDEQGASVISLEARVRAALAAEYGDQTKPLNVVVISDGARHIRCSLQAIFGQCPTVILDWYHLRKKTAELMSMIAFNKHDKEHHLSEILKHLWSGSVDTAVRYLRTQVVVRNTAKHEELIGYLEKHSHEIIDYEKRQHIGKPIGSGRMEKGVDQVIGHRQKKKGMAWSAKGSKALAILKVIELNGLWGKLWGTPQPPLGAMA